MQPPEILSLGKLHDSSRDVRIRIGLSQVDSGECRSPAAVSPLCKRSESCADAGRKELMSRQNRLQHRQVHHCKTVGLVLEAEVASVAGTDFAHMLSTEPPFLRICDFCHLTFDHGPPAFGSAWHGIVGQVLG